MKLFTCLLGHTRNKEGICTRCGRPAQTTLDKKNALIKQLKSASAWEQRRNAAQALADYPYAGTVAALVSSLQKDSEWVVRFSCAEALGKIGDVAAVKPLIAALEDKESSVVAYSARALGIIGDERAIEPLIRHLDRRNRRYGDDYLPIEASYEALGRFGERVTRRLLECLHDSAVYGEAIRALALTGDRAAVPALIACARDTNQETQYRVDAVKGLGRTDCPASRDALLDLLDSIGNFALVEAVVDTLGIPRTHLRTREEVRGGGIGADLDRKCGSSFLSARSVKSSCVWI